MPTPKKDKGGSTPSTDNSNDWVSSLTVAKLRDELKKRKYATTGVKAELADRLLAALQAEGSGDDPASDDTVAEKAAEKTPVPDASASVDDKTPKEDSPSAPEITMTTSTTPLAAPSEPGVGHMADPSVPEPMQDEPVKSAAKPAEPEQIPVQQEPEPEPEANTVEDLLMDEVDYGDDDEAPAEDKSTPPPEDKPSAAQPGQVSRNKRSAADSNDASSEALDKQQALLPSNTKEIPASEVPVAPSPSEPTPAANLSAKSEDKPPATRPGLLTFNPPDKSKPSASTPSATPDDTRPAKLQRLSSASLQPPKLVTPGAGSKPASASGPPAGTPSCALYIEGMVRPFTERQLKELLESKGGKVVDMWMTSIKSKCWVVMESEEQATTALHATHQLQWPAGNATSILRPRYIDAAHAQEVIQAGKEMKPLPLEPGSSAAVAAAKAAADRAVTPAGRAPVVVTPVPTPGASANGRAAAAAPAASSGSRRDTLGLALQAANKDAVAAVERKSSATASEAPGQSRKPAAAQAPAASAPPTKLPTAAPPPKVEEPPPLTLDDFFKRTTTAPPLYWLPVGEAQAEQNRKLLAADGLPPQSAALPTPPAAPLPPPPALPSRDRDAAAVKERDKDRDKDRGADKDKEKDRGADGRRASDPRVKSDRDGEHDRDRDRARESARRPDDKDRRGSAGGDRDRDRDRGRDGSDRRRDSSRDRDRRR